MADTGDWNKIGAGISDQQVVALEQAAIRIPSTTFEEGKIADLFANYMSDLGLDVEMMEVTHWAKPGQKTRQPIGRLKGTGGGPSLMLNGHMDPGVEMSGWSVDPYGAKFEDGWVWGMGAHDDKGGVVAAICAVEAIVRSGVRLRGDVVVTPVVAHKLGGAGTRALMAKGLRTDLAINMEHSANTIANDCVGIVMVRIKTKSPELFFRYSKEARAQYMNPIEQQAEIIRRIGPSLDPIKPGGWLRFTPHADLPGFPTHTFDTMHKEHYYQKSYTGMSSRECEMVFQLRTVPGQTLTHLRGTFAMLADQDDRPAFDAELTIPRTGWRSLVPGPMRSAHPKLGARSPRAICLHCEKAVVAWGRLGNVGDGNILMSHGIPTVQYGAGDIRIYKEWPTPDERVPLKDLVTAARAVAYATHQLCG